MALARDQDELILRSLCKLKKLKKWLESNTMDGCYLVRALRYGKLRTVRNV